MDTKVETKGILLAGGTGSRLFPMTLPVCKQLLPVYDKPMVYYPLSTLMLAGVRDIVVVTTPRDAAAFQDLLGDGSRFGVTLRYVAQPKPEGIAQAFLLAEPHIAGHPVCLALGDNIIHGSRLGTTLKQAVLDNRGATVFGCTVTDPQRYGVADFDETGRVLSIEEKPSAPKSNVAVIGLYMYDSRVVDMARSLRPSARGELEITDINRLYIESGDLDLDLLGRGYAWLDMGTPDSLLDATQYIAAIFRRQGMKVCCPEEIAWRQGWIDDARLMELAGRLGSSEYAAYLKTLLLRRSFERLNQPA